MGSLDEYFAAILRNAAAVVGPSNLGGTVVAPAPDRAGTGSASSYPTPTATVVWCDPALAERLAPLAGPTPISTDDFVESATALGARLIGRGNNRVLAGPLQRPRSDTAGFVERPIDPSDQGDRSLLTELAEACSEDDVDEADLDLDDLDPVISALIAPTGSIAAYAAARPSGIDASFDDLAVLTHPAFRRRRFGAFVVHEFIVRRAGRFPQRRMLYRCATANAGSNALAESLGFTMAHTMGAVRFDL